MQSEFQVYFEKAEELKRATALLLRTYTNPKSPAKEFHDQRNKVSGLITDLNKCRDAVKGYLEI